MIKLSVIVTCLNEKDNIASTIKRINKVVPDAEIIIVDDGSEDNTSEVAMDTLCKLYKGQSHNFQIIKYNPNRGKGYAIKQGVLAANGEIQVQLDADCQFQPEEIPYFIEEMEKRKVDLLLCDRFGGSCEKGSVTFMRRIASLVVSTYVSLLSGRYLPSTWFHDINAGFKAWTKEMILDVDFKCEKFDYEGEIIILAYKKGYKIDEVPINYKKRLEGETKVNLWRDGVQIPWSLFKIWLFK